jgi:hypothetical protein
VDGVVLRDLRARAVRRIRVAAAFLAARTFPRTTPGTPPKVELEL